MMKPYALLLAALLSCPVLFAQKPDRVPPEVMRQTYEEVKTPYKYGLIMIPEPGKMIDSPSIFRDNGEVDTLLRMVRESYGTMPFANEAYRTLLRCAAPYRKIVVATGVMIAAGTRTE